MLWDLIYVADLQPRDAKVNHGQKRANPKIDSKCLETKRVPGQPALFSYRSLMLHRVFSCSSSRTIAIFCIVPQKSVSIRQVSLISMANHARKMKLRAFP